MISVNSDHQNCFGFIRVLRGSLKITSFSFVDDVRRERELHDFPKKASGDEDLRPVIYEGKKYSIKSVFRTLLFILELRNNV